ncbi:MAG TPA: cupin domain-containing protein [Actinomycetota bacterium]|nr:cupin domain-containing protein [Actinomycetota bacterium]
MAPGIEVKNFDSPDETRTPENTKIEVVRVGGSEVGRFTFQPGWKWSENIKPIVKTDSCQVAHLGYVVSGKLHVVHEDGTEGESGAGDIYSISPGHDAWVVGDEPVVLIEFNKAGEYAKG